MTTQLLLTEAEAADRLRISARTLRKARAAGILPYVLIGRAVRYTMADLESYIEHLRRQPAPCRPSPVTNNSRPKRRSGRHRSAQIIPFSARQ